VIDALRKLVKMPDYAAPHAVVDEVVILVADHQNVCAELAKANKELDRIRNDHWVEVAELRAQLAREQNARRAAHEELLLVDAEKKIMTDNITRLTAEVQNKLNLHHQQKTGE